MQAVGKNIVPKFGVLPSRGSRTPPTMRRSFCPVKPEPDRWTWKVQLRLPTKIVSFKNPKPAGSFKSRCRYRSDTQCLTCVSGKSQSEIVSFKKPKPAWFGESDIAFPAFLHRMIHGAGGESHERERRVLVARRGHGRAIGHEHILAGVQLVPFVEQ